MFVPIQCTLFLAHPRFVDTCMMVVFKSKQDLSSVQFCVPVPIIEVHYFGFYTGLKTADCIETTSQVVICMITKLGMHDSMHWINACRDWMVHGVDCWGEHNKCHNYAYIHCLYNYNYRICVEDDFWQIYMLVSKYYSPMFYELWRCLNLSHAINRMEVASACISEWNIYMELNGPYPSSVCFKVKISSTGRAFEPGLILV